MRLKVCAATLKLRCESRFLVVLLSDALWCTRDRAPKRKRLYGLAVRELPPTPRRRMEGLSFCCKCKDFKTQRYNAPNENFSQKQNQPNEPESAETRLSRGLNEGNSKQLGQTTAKVYRAFAES